MMKHYNICGLTVECDFRHGIMLSRSEKYLCDKADVDISIPFNPAAMEHYERIALHLSPDERELMYTAHDFYIALLNFNGFMLHSSAVEVDGQAYLFSAPSGTGKSTHTSLWLELFGDKAQIINDDKPAIRITDNGIYAYGTPWSGKSDLNVNEGYPLGGICVLERSEHNFINPLDEGTAVFSILNQTIRPQAPEAMGQLLTLLDTVIKQVPVWKMGCNISVDAAKMAYEAMSRATPSGSSRLF